MSKIKIDVRGTHTIALPPERGVLSATVALEGSPASTVIGDVTHHVSVVRRMIEHLYDEAAGPVTWYSIDQVRSSAHRPWNKDGVQLPLVHRASAEFEIKFSDFAALGRFVHDAATVAGFSVGYIDWRLTDAHRLQVERQARQEAVRNAKAIAQEYAEALQLGTVAVRRLAGSGSSRSDDFDARLAGSFNGSLDSSSEGENLLKPQDIEVASVVEARFVVVP